MFPRWLTWLFILFLGYMVVSTHRSATAPEAPVESREPARENRAIRALLDGERWKRALEPHRAAPDAPSRCSAPPPEEGAPRSLAVVEREGEGEGEEAACGARIRLAVTLWQAGGGAAQQLGDVALVLGEQPRLDALLVGMRTGETRQLVLSMPKHPYEALPELGAQGWRMLTVTRHPEDAETEKEKAGH